MFGVFAASQLVNNKNKLMIKIRNGYEMRYTFPEPTPTILMLNIHHSRTNDLITPDVIKIDPPTATTGYHDSFGNWCTRLLAPAGDVTFSSDSTAFDIGLPDVVAPFARQTPVDQLPDDALVFLLASRFCESDEMSGLAWSLFGYTQPGWARVQAVCDFVHNHIQFGYGFARSNRTAMSTYNEGRGVCRDFAHLAVAFCRALNIPTRYCTGYLGDVGLPPPYPPGDFSAWFEVYLDGQWYTFDARHNKPRIGRVLMARGRDAADVAMVTTFGSHILQSFSVWSDEVVSQPAQLMPFT